MENNIANKGKQLITTVPKPDRDEKGRWVKGCVGPNPNPQLARKKQDPLKKYIRKAVGNDGQDLINELLLMAIYDQKDAKDRWERIKVNERYKAIELLLAYGFDKPTQKVEAEIETKSVNIEVKLPEGMIPLDI